MNRSDRSVPPRHPNSRSPGSPSPAAPRSASGSCHELPADGEGRRRWIREAIFPGTGQAVDQVEHGGVEGRMVDPRAETDEVVLPISSGPTAGRAEIGPHACQRSSRCRDVGEYDHDRIASGLPVFPPFIPFVHPAYHPDPMVYHPVACRPGDALPAGTPPGTRRSFLLFPGVHVAYRRPVARLLRRYPVPVHLSPRGTPGGRSRRFPSRETFIWSGQE